MINRILIRIKVLQTLFACYQGGENDCKVAENALLMSLRRSYDLYYYFLLLIVEVTFMQERKIDAGRHKLLPTEEELNPNMRFVNNRFVRQLGSNAMMLSYAKEHGISWTNEQGFVRKVLNIILSSDIYRAYMDSDDDSYQADRELWRAIFKHLISGNEDLQADLEDISIYWNDDVEIIETFVIKTIKRFDETAGAAQELLPMFRDQADYEFAVNLFRLTLQQKDYVNDIIYRHTRNWDSERVATMDMIIMQLALTEMLNFPEIPINVTLNEYIDAAKYYSTPKSAVFINGILDSIVKELKNKKILLKE
ncbi:MAG: transcription antitermination factor NusB [Tannerella sp.]|jgi:N utilization substance protein B|nr:transcription antitermination factor NusB [Tannerella sp.]